MSLKLPVLASWVATLSRWATELRHASFVFSEDVAFGTWTPTYGPSANFALASQDWAWYIKIDRTLIFIIQAFGTTTGTPPAISFTIPFDVGPDAAGGFGVQVNDGGSEIGGCAFTNAGSDIIQITKGTGALWSAGTGRRFRVLGVVRTT